MPSASILGGFPDDLAVLVEEAEQRRAVATAANDRTQLSVPISELQPRRAIICDAKPEPHAVAGVLRDDFQAELGAKRQRTARVRKNKTLPSFLLDGAGTCAGDEEGVRGRREILSLPDRLATGTCQNGELLDLVRIEDLRDVSFDLRDVSSLVFSDDTCGNFFFGKMAHTLLLPGADRYENLIYISLDYVEEEDDPTQIADTLVHELAHDYVDEKTHGGAWETNYEAWRSAIFEDIAVWEVRMRQVMSNIFDFLVDAVPDIVTDILSGNAPDVSKDE